MSGMEKGDWRDWRLRVYSVEKLDFDGVWEGGVKIRPSRIAYKRRVARLMV